MNGIEGGANGQRLRMFVSLHVIARQNHSIVAFSPVLRNCLQLFVKASILSQWAGARRRN